MLNYVIRLLNDSYNLNNGFDKLLMQTEEIERIYENVKLYFQKCKRFKFVTKFHIKTYNTKFRIL